jgi:hypothetical protein
MPRLAPVTNAVLPSSFFKTLSCCPDGQLS